MENLKRNFKGITLIALVVTIIVLLILAGITIASLAGENGILNQAQNSSVETEKGKIIEDLQLAYMDICTETKETPNIEPATVETLIEKLIKNYGYKEEQFSKVITKNLILSNTNVKLRPNQTQDINVTIDENSISTYFVIIDGKYYKIIFEENNLTLGEVKNTLPTKEEVSATVESRNDIINAELKNNVITISTKEGQFGEAIVKVSYGAIDKTIKVKVNEFITDIGDVVVNNTVLKNDWQYFYDDETNIYLIYDEYLENNMIPTAPNIIKNGYRVYLDNTTSHSRWDLINYLRDINIWSNIADGVKSAIEAKGVKIDGEVTATGVPTLTLFQQAFNKMYGKDKFEIKKFNEGDYNGDTPVNAEGYLYRLVGDTNYIDQIDIPTDNKVFFPHINKWNSTWGYWLASDSAVGGGDVCFVDSVRLLK